MALGANFRSGKLGFLNLDLVNRKGNAAVVLTFIFLLEVGALGLWLTFALGA